MKTGLSAVALSLVIALTLPTAVLPKYSGPEPVGASEWHIEVADYEGLVSPFVSLALDGNGYPHISYRDRSAGDLKYAKWNGSTWRIEVVDFSGDVGWHTSLSLDSNDNPHISYRNGSSDSLKYARWDGTSWSIETVDSVGVHGGTNALGLDSKDIPHIAYHDYTKGNLKYAKWTGTNWSIETVDSDINVGKVPSLAIDSNDRPHISYFDIYYTNLKYAKWTGTNWSIETVDSDGMVGWGSSIALDSNDVPHISYHDHDFNYDLKYAKWTGTNWSIQTVDDTGLFGIATSIAIDSNDDPHIGYHYWANHSSSNLKYAKWTGTNWSIETVDSDGIVGKYLSLALDSNDYPHIGYHDDIADDLKYATKAELQPPPVLAYFPSSLDFDDLPPGAVDAKTFKIWNSGVGILRFTLGEASNWIASVSPQRGASTGELDAITVSIDTTGLSEGRHTDNISITSNGGNGNISVSVNVLAPRSISLDIDPDTLNLNSKGRWITAYLTSEDADVRDIDVSSLLLNDMVSPARWDIQKEDVLMVKFDRSAVQAILPISNAVDIKVTGQWKDGETFEVHDIIRVIDVGGHRESPWSIHSREGTLLIHLRIESVTSSAYMEIEGLQTSLSETDMSPIPVAPDGREGLSHYSSKARSPESCLYRASSIAVSLI